MDKLVEEIHGVNLPCVMHITGGGTGVISKLLKYGGGSKTLLEAVVPYSEESFTAHVSEIPPKFVCKEAAINLAKAAYDSACEITRYSKCCGIGATAKLRKENERSGRTHEIYIAMYNYMSLYGQTHLAHFEFKAERTRVIEEELASHLILFAMGRWYGASLATDNYLTSYFRNEEGVDFWNEKLS